MDTVRVTAEWALWGKQPDDRGYGLLEWSPGRLSSKDFNEIMGRFSAGTPDELPEVTLSWFGRDENAHLGLAIQEWSGKQDKLGRDIAVTRYYCVSYAQLARTPVSYASMYETFDRRSLPVSGPLTVSLPVLEPNAIAKRVTEQAMGTAALLMTRAPVCVVGADTLSLGERLRFLDTVASLLPYGMRSKFSASTWTSSTAQHRIRLSFAEHPRDHGHTVVWGESVRLPFEASTAREYLTALAGCPDTEELIRGLADANRPLGFQPEDVVAALALVDRSSRSRLFPVPTRTPHTSADAMLTECADALSDGDAGRVEMSLARLRHLRSERLTDEERNRCRKIIKDRRMLAEKQPVSHKLRDHVLTVVLQLAFGPWLTVEGLHCIEDAAGELHRPLLLALRLMPTYDVPVRLQIALRLGADELRETLTRMSADELVAAAAQNPPDAWTVEVVYEELVSRGAAGDDHSLAPALYAYDYLGPELQALYPGKTDIQHSILGKLLRAAYGPTLGREEFREVIGRRTELPTMALLSAAVVMYGQGAREVLADAFTAALINEGSLPSKTRRQLEQALTAPVAPHRPQRPAGHRPRRPKRRGPHVEERPAPATAGERGSGRREERFYAPPLSRWLAPLLIGLAVAAIIVIVGLAVR